MLRASRTVGLAIVLLSCFTARLAAQAIHGTVADDKGEPAVGAIVVLLDSAGKPVAGGLADVEGKFEVHAPRAGRYSIRIDRIGHASHVTERVELTTGSVLVRRFVALAAPVQLTEVVISKVRRCVRRPEEGSAIARVWDEARKALTAADLAGDEGLLRVRVAQYARDLDGKKRVRREQRSQREGVTRNPFVSIPPESLATGGFIQTTAAGTWYYAPDAEVLVSEEFLDNYCFSLQRGKGETASMIGVAFEPAKRNRLAGITGVLWVDERTAELRHVEYLYTQLPGGVESDEVGGRIEFKRLPRGVWLVQRWHIRMPVIQRQKATFRRPGDLELETTLGNPTVVGFRDEGGEVLEVMGASGQTFAAKEGRIEGSVYDSTRATPLAGAEVALMGTAFAAVSGRDGTFELNGVPEGEYTLTFYHPRLDTLGVILPGADISVKADRAAHAVAAIPSSGALLSALCPGEQPRGTGVVTGVVRDSRGHAVAGAAVNAGWTGTWAGDATTLLRAPAREASARTEPDGRYRLCSVPLDEIVELAAAAPGGSTARIKIPARTGEITVVDVAVRGNGEASTVSLDTAADVAATGMAGGVSLRHEPGTGVVTGKVVDANGQALESAQLRVVGSGVSVQTTATGTFRLALPTGSYVFDVRRLGYSRARFTVEVRGDRNVSATVQLAAAPQRLAELVVERTRGTSAAVAPGFTERQRRLNGVFIDRQRINREQPLQLTDLLRGAPGIHLQAMKALAGVTYMPQMRRASRVDGVCPMSYYLDGMEFEPSDQGIDMDVRAADIEAVEVYQPMQVPAQFANDRARRCGVMVIWTRRDA